MKSLRIEIGGELKKVWAQKLGGSYWIHYEGRTFEYVPPSKTRKKGVSAGVKGEPGKIVAPMPGKIIKVHCDLGNEVKVNDPLVTMEAMKMEYCLKADLDGVIQSIHCNADDQVTMGQLLVDLVEG